VHISLSTYARNNIWKDDFSLWMDVLRKNPESAREHHNLGIAYKSKGLINRANKHLGIARRLNPAFFNKASHH
jgi:hypothetical protein